MQSSIRAAFSAAVFVSLAAISAVPVEAGAQQLTNEGVAPSGPVSEMVRMSEPQDEFHLYSGHDVELVRF